MLIEVGKQYWYPTHKKACRCTAINILEKGKEVLYVVKSVLSSIDSLKTPMKVVGSGMQQPVVGPWRYPLFNTERGAVQHTAKRLYDEATEMMGRLDDETDSDSPDKEELNIPRT